MTDILFPPVIANSSSLQLVSNTEVFRSPLTGAVQTVDRTGERWRLTLNFTNLNGADRHLIQQFIAEMNGQKNRAIVYDPSYVRRGAISAGSIQTDPYAADVSTNYASRSAANVTATQTSRGVRIRQIGATTSGVDNTTDMTSVSGRSYAAQYAFQYRRAQNDPVLSMRVDSGAGGASNDVLNFEPAANVDGYFARGITAVGSNLEQLVVVESAEVGDVVDWHLCDMTRALLVDNALNQFTYSEQFDNAAWTKGATTVTANAATAPDGTTTADRVIQASGSATHTIGQSKTKSSAQEYWTLSVWAKADALDFVGLIIDNTVDQTRMAVDLTDGSLDYTQNAANQENPIYTVDAYANDWYRLRMTVRTTTSTTIRGFIVPLQNADGSFTETGDGTSGILLWGAQFHKGSQLGRYVQTTDAAATAASQTGSSLWVKGLDRDTTGQLVAGDMVEVNGQLVMLTADLDGDESGVGQMFFTPRLRTAPADEDAVVLHNPRGRFLLENNENGLSSKPGNSNGAFSDVTLTFIEDIAS